jgi:hypothetical protein
MEFGIFRIGDCDFMMFIQHAPNTLLYQEIVGSLNHLAVYNRPDITFVVS